MRQWVQQCWPCDGTGVTPDGRFGPAVVVIGKRARDHVVVPKAVTVSPEVAIVKLK